MKIRQGASLVQEVIYEGDVKGEGLVICLSQEDPASTVTWLITVYVHINQGWWHLGYFVTNTPAVDGAAARVVGFASCPGAKGWKAVVRNATAVPNESFDAELTLQAGLCCGGGSPYGVFIPPPPGTGGVPTTQIES